MITFSRLGRLGRFGNQLFQYAGARLYAEAYDYAWGFPHWDGEHLFDLPHVRASMFSFMSPTLQLEDIQSTNWSERLLTPLGLWKRSSISYLYKHPRSNINFYGYLQDDFSIGKLHEHKEKIRSWFRFRTEINDVCRKATDKYRPWAAVHIRRGDMVKRGAATNTADALEHAGRLRGQRSLYIASDDPDVRLGLTGQATITPTNPVPELQFAFDFWMLMESEVLIGSGSTFSWFAAFLGGAQYWSPPLNRTWRAGPVPPIERQVL